MAKLYPYQETGASFLAERSRALLADGMRLGKTPQAVRAADLVDARRILVVTPASAVFNWPAEHRRFALNDRLLYAIDGRPDPRKLAEREIMVSISWDGLRRHAAALREYRWDLLLPDEAHYAKNHETERTKALYGSKCDGVDGISGTAEAVWPLTGTPTPNHPGELWPMLRALFPDRILEDGKPMPQRRFLHRYCVVVPKVFNGRRVETVVNGQNLDELHERIRPIMLRRRAEDVTGRPPLTYTPITVDPGPALKVIREAEGEWALSDVLRNLGDDDDLIEALTAAGGDHVARIRQLTGMAKASACADLVTEELENGLSKIVLFSWHKAVMDCLSERLARFGVARIDGGTRDRHAEYTRFQEDPTCRVFNGQIIAAGEAIPLWAADDLLFVEHSFTPKDMAQAAMRIFHVQKTRPGLVRFAGLAGSIDDAMARVLARKVEMIRGTLR